MKDRLKCRPVPIELPIGAEDTFRGIIDLMEMKADVYYDELGKDMPGDNIEIDVDLITPIAIEEGLRFAIREGGRTVGSGVVTKINS